MQRLYAHTVLRARGHCTQVIVFLRVFRSLLAEEGAPAQPPRVGARQEGCVFVQFLTGLEAALRRDPARPSSSL